MITKSSTAALEIASLRRLEGEMDRQATEVDRIIGALLPIYKCDFVIDNAVSIGAWVPLPSGWQRGVKDVQLRLDRLPTGHRGAVAVSLDTLRYLHKGVFG